MYYESNINQYQLRNGGAHPGLTGLSKPRQTVEILHSRFRIRFHGAPPMCMASKGPEIIPTLAEVANGLAVPEQKIGYSCGGHTSLSRIYTGVLPQVLFDLISSVMSQTFSSSPRDLRQRTLKMPLTSAH